MTDKTTEALKLAEEALEELRYANDTDIAKTKYYKALAAIRESLAEPVKQEPVAWRYNSNGDWIYKDRKVWDDAEPLYAAPVDAKAIRAEALEEAAKVCDFENHQLTGMRMDNEAWAAKNCAAAIRSLK